MESELSQTGRARRWSALNPSALGDWIWLARPLDWLKNSFVLMPLPFALAAGVPLPLGRFAAGLLAFSLANSAVYAFNDAQDARHDRLHKSKRHRPVAAERITPCAARRFAAALAALALALGAVGAGSTAVGLTALYLALNVVYSAGAKHVPLVDVFILSSGFVLRVLLGCALLDVTPSNWLLVCASSLSLFLGLTKRRADLAEGIPGAHRPVLAHYSREFLDQAMTLAAGASALAYALYSVESTGLRPGRELAPLPFVVFGILEYLRCATVRGEGGSPAHTLLRSPALLLCGVGWVAAALWSVRWD